MGGITAAKLLSVCFCGNEKVTPLLIKHFYFEAADFSVYLCVDTGVCLSVLFV